MNSLAQIDIGETFNSPIGQSIQLVDIVSIILSNAVFFAGVIMLFLAVGGGIMVIVGAGRDDPQTTGKGKQAVTAALIGFIIIFTAYWIIQIIERLTGLEILNPVI